MYLLAKLGRVTTGTAMLIVELTGLLSLTLRETHNLFKTNRWQLFWLLFKRQLFNTGFRAAYVNTAIAIVLGWFVMSRVYDLMPAGASTADYFGQVFVIVVVRELGAIVSGLILIARSASAITYEIGHLKLFQEFEVLESLRMSPAFVFLLPVFYAFPLSLLLMFFYFSLVCCLSSFVCIRLMYDASIQFVPFLEAILRHISLDEAVITLTKGILGGGLIGLISIYYGTRVGGRFTDVSRAISNSSTAQLLVFFLLNLSLSVMVYG